MDFELAALVVALAVEAGIVAATVNDGGEGKRTRDWESQSK